MPQIEIKNDELQFTFSRSGGPGGQNVNKVNTKVTLIFNIRQSTDLNDEQKERIMYKLAGRLIDQEKIQVVSQRYRSQAENKEDAKIKLMSLLEWAMRKEKTRKKTKVPHGEKMKRLEKKRRRSEIKKLRGSIEY